MLAANNYSFFSLSVYSSFVTSKGQVIWICIVLKKKILEYFMLYASFQILSF